MARGAGEYGGGMLERGAGPRGGGMLERMIALLKDPLFCKLRQAADARPLSRREFATYDMPAGVGVDQAWEILCTLRRHTAVDLPYADGQGRRGWYSLTRSTLEDLDAINRQCHEGSWLDRAIRSHNTTYFLVEAHIGEAMAVAQEDGVSIGYEKAREVLLNERDPENGGEALILNGHRAVWDIDDYDSQPCTPKLIMDLHEKVAKGAGAQRGRPPKQQTRLWRGKGLDGAATLALASDLVNRASAAGGEHPLLLGMAVRHLFMSNHPLPSWNGASCALVMKLLFRRGRLPVLVFAPVNKVVQDWQSGALRPPKVAAPIEESGVLVDGEIDYTLYVGELARLVREAVEGIEQELRRALRRDEAFSHMLREDLQINHRQRQLLQVALRNPETVFDIGSHRKAHRVAYATARADLMKLADLGFLACLRKGRAFRFHVVPGLRKLLARSTQD